MDLFFSYLLQLAILCISLLYIFFTIYIKKYTSPKLPPGRRGWPIIGETLEFGKACKNGDVEKFITQRMTKYSPDLFRTSLFQENFAVFCGASGNKFLFSTANKYVTPWWPRFIVEALNFPTEMECFKDELTKLRAMVLEFLKPEALQRYVPIMDSMAKEHLEIGWSPYKQVKVLPLTKEYTIAVACRVFIDIKDPERLNRFANLFHQITTGLLSLPIKLPGTAFSRAIRQGKLLLEEMLGIIRERKMELLETKGPAKEDMLTRLLLIIDENGQGMNEKSIACQIAGMLIGSYDTTSSTITSVLRYLVEFPHVYNEVLKAWTTQQFLPLTCKTQGDERSGCQVVPTPTSKSCNGYGTLYWWQVSPCHVSRHHAVLCVGLQSVPCDRKGVRDACTISTAEKNERLALSLRISFLDHLMRRACCPVV